MSRSEKQSSFFLTPVSRKLVEIIEHGAEELTQSWLRDVKRQLELPTYRSYNEQELFRRAYRVYSQLGRWISQEMSREEIREYWTSLGRERRREGFALSEIVQSLCLIRRHLWLKVESEGLLDTALDLRQALELYTRVMFFFDRAIYFAAVGFEGKDGEPDGGGRRK